MKHDDDAHLRHVDPADIFALTRPDDKLLTLYLIYSIMTLAAFPFVFLPLYFRFKTLRYRFDDRGVAVSYGLLWRRESYLTYARIQDIHVSRNIIERWLGLGSVEIQTAAGNAGAAETIAGVRRYDDIRNFLYARMRGHHPVSPVQASGSGQHPDSVLAAIRDELHAIRTTLEARPRV
jgi:membrane protein YdbS with pleckstrin-like domain